MQFTIGIKTLETIVGYLKVYILINLKKIIRFVFFDKREKSFIIIKAIGKFYLCFNFAFSGMRNSSLYGSLHHLERYPCLGGR